MNQIINLGNGQFVKVTMLKGERGSNIATITKTGTSGLVDTYTITLTDGSTTSFDVKNGSSIDHITKTSSVGSVDTYTIYLTDGTVGGTFEVNNAIATVEQNFSSTSTNPLMNKTLTNIIAGVENGSTASKTYYANDLILRNDSLYEVLTTVAVGSAWADGVNISETTLGDLVSQINADLSAIKSTPLFSTSDFVELNENVPYNSSYTVPVDGYYLFELTSTGNTAIMYYDSARTKAIISGILNSKTQIMRLLKKDTVLYTRNVSGHTYTVVGYTPC